MLLRTAFEQFFKKRETPCEYRIRDITVLSLPNEKKSVEDLFDALACIPSGQKALNDMAKYRTTFCLDSFGGNTNAYLEPESNRIVLSRSSDFDTRCFLLVHEARHLSQYAAGRREADAKHLDFASRLMILRATEADAQTQAFLACSEWEAQGNGAPMQRFKKHYPCIVSGYEAEKGLSGAFKGWYDDELVGAVYEQNHCTIPRLSNLTAEPSKEPFVSLKPSDISKFCEGSRIKDFENFLNSRKARRVYLLTKTIAEIYDSVSVSKGARHDPSVPTLPLNDLQSNPYARMGADLQILKTENSFSPQQTKNTVKKNILKAVAFTVDAVEKINHAQAKGKRDEKAETELRQGKERVLAATEQKGVKAFFSAYFSRSCR